MTPKKAATWIAFGAIVKRNLMTATPTRKHPLHGTTILQTPHHQSIASSTALRARRIPRNHFTSNRVNRQNDASDRDATRNASPRKSKTGKRGGTNSLRKVAVEAQRSRLGHSLLIKGSGRTRHVDPDADTKEVAAYCAAETYNMSQAKWELKREGYTIDPCGTGLFPQVLHIRTPNYIAKDESTGENTEQGEGDVFVFPSGCVVTWNVPERLAYNLVHRVLPSTASDTGHLDKLESEELDYIEDPSKDASMILGDTIIFGTKAQESHEGSESSTRDKDDDRTPETDIALAKIAFSSALARSTKLAVLENSLNAYFSSTRSIPLTLAAGKKVSFNRSQILQKTGELLLIRAQLNLYSELTDSLPDLFWDSPHELGLEGYYEMVGKALDIGVRIKSLNEKMDYASEIATILREQSSEKHSASLEWMIIFLICIEVGFGFIHLWRESDALVEKEEERRTRELFEVWLERDLRKNHGMNSQKAD